MKSLRKTLIAFITAITGLPVAANDKPHTDTDPRGQYISHKKAADIAVKSVGGGRAIDIALDRDWHGDHFAVDVRTQNGDAFAVVIDARSGKVLSRTRDA